MLKYTNKMNIISKEYSSQALTIIC